MPKKASAGRRGAERNATQARGGAAGNGQQAGTDAVECAATPAGVEVLVTGAIEQRATLVQKKQWKKKYSFCHRQTT